MNMYPHVTQFEENRRELEREYRQRQQIRAARAARKAARPPRFAALRAWVRGALRPEPCPPLIEEC